MSESIMGFDRAVKKYRAVFGYDKSLGDAEWFYIQGKLDIYEELKKEVV